MNTATIRTWLTTLGRFLLAYAGSAVCLLVTTAFASTIDAWFTTGQFTLPFSPSENPVAGLGYLALAAIIATTALLAITTLPLLMLKREGLVAYLILCGALPLFFLVLPATEGILGQEALLYDFRGRLFAFELKSGKRQLLLKDNVIDVSSAGDGPAWILSAPPLPDNLKYDAPLPAGSLTLSRYRSNRIEALSPVEYGLNERPLIIVMRGEDPILIGRSSAFIFDSSRSVWRKVAFNRTISDQLQSSYAAALISSDGKTAFVGVNQGEWGGGLTTINLATGEVNRLEKRGPNLCDGPLNSDCDPVTGIVPDANDSRCVLASIGLSHLLMHGRVIRVCPGGVSVELIRPLERPSQVIERSIRKLVTGTTKKHLNTEAFFALIETREGSIWAISPFAAYRREGKSWSRHSLPELEKRGFLNVSEDLPGVVLLSRWRTREIQ